MEKVLRILAFGGALAAGVLCIVFAITYRNPALYGFAVVAFFGGITGFLFATSGEPTGGVDPLKVGGKFLGLPDWVLLADAGLIVVAVILAFVIH